jgi:acyl-CoA dehydrogenase
VDDGRALPDRDADYRRAVAVAATGAHNARGLWHRLGAGDLLDPLLPKSGSRGEVDRQRLADLVTELDGCLPAGLVLSVCVQVATAMPLLHASAASPLAGQVLAEASRGDVIVALAATDAGLSGSALLDIRTEVRDSGDGLVLCGGKEWISNASHCDYALVLARHRQARHFTSFCWVLVPAGLDGVCCQAEPSQVFAGAGLGHLRFDSVRLGPEHVVGRPGRALAEFAVQIATERLAGALWARALCRRVLIDTHDYLRHRPAGDGTLWDNQAVREHFARCLVELHRLDALCAAHCAGPGPAAEAMMLKAACAQGADQILSECVSLRGADAFTDGGVGRLREQAAMFGIAGGATGAMLAGVASHADELLKRVG